MSAKVATKGLRPEVPEFPASQCRRHPVERAKASTDPTPTPLPSAASNRCPRRSNPPFGHVPSLAFTLRRKPSPPLHTHASNHRHSLTACSPRNHCQYRRFNPGRLPSPTLRPSPPTHPPPPPDATQNSTTATPDHIHSPQHAYEQRKCRIPNWGSNGPLETPRTSRCG